jgi:MFS family permease
MAQVDDEPTRNDVVVQEQRPHSTDGQQDAIPWERPASIHSSLNQTPRIDKWSFGILNDKHTEEVPGTVLLLASNRNEPLGMQHHGPGGASHSRSSIASSMPQQPFESRRSSTVDKKRTSDGKMILDPQPDDSPNDPLNWPAWRRDIALLCLGFYCMVGGGMTPILAAGFNNVAQDYGVSFAQVALTTGLYMAGMGVGSVFFSPTAILFGKRPVYLFSAILFIGTSIWCSESPSYGSLVAARIFQGFSVSPVECLPSASIAEIFFLHERAFRIGIYTLLLLGGKNLVPLVSAVIIQSLGWRWVFRIVAVIVAFSGALLFFFVPETFWDRTPRPRTRRSRSRNRSVSSLITTRKRSRARETLDTREMTEADLEKVMTPRQHRLHEQNVHAHFSEPDAPVEHEKIPEGDHRLRVKPSGIKLPAPAAHPGRADPSEVENYSGMPHLHNLNSPYYTQLENDRGYLDHHTNPHPEGDEVSSPISDEKAEIPSQRVKSDQRSPSIPKLIRYTTNLRQAPAKTYAQTLKPWNGRLSQVSWFRVAVRPFILFAYPSVLWSTLVYSLSVGWLIVLSESVAHVYKNQDTYNFSSLAVGLVYLSPFVGGVCGTAIAGKVSDIIVQFMARRNGGVYEPEFRLVMAIPIAITTAIGLMGFGWSVEERDAWIVPTVMFGIISFGCSLGSTTAITFCVDSYRQYAGEALVTLNFSKNIFHGLVFSLFFPNWLEHEGPKDVFITIGSIQVACLLTTIPMYIYGKRARMWTVRKGFMDKF